MAGAPKGNSNAKKGMEARNALRRSLCKRAIAFKAAYKKEHGEPYPNPDELTNFQIGLELVADHMLDREKDALPVFNAVADRIDGKPSQDVQLSGDPENPIGILPFEFVAPSDPEET